MKVKSTHFVQVSLVILALLISLSSAETKGRLRKRLPPYEYGTVILNQVSEKKDVAPVVFRHWSHRAKYTCRLCHIDVGFAMENGETTIYEDDNRAGRYCGACHNGKEAFDVRDKKNCKRCHSPYPVGLDQDAKRHFYQVTKGLPRGRFGNGVDWTKAEELKLIKPKDKVPGILFIRTKLKREKGELELTAKVPGLPDIIFSHKKHSVWNGCEICHPDIFTMKRGKTKFEMVDNFDGRYCGACHGKVAFPLRDCGLCHTKPVSF